jgi:outer membrane protein assembly factor BamB
VSIWALLFPTFDSLGQARFSLSSPLNVIWQYETERTINLTPATGSASVYLPLTSGTLLSIQVSDGKLNWRTEIGGEISASPVADERAVYIASETVAPPSSTFSPATGTIRALSAQTGVTLWMRTLPKPIQGATISNETTLFGGAADGRLYAIRKQSGEVLWIREFKTPFNSHPVISGERLYIGAEDGTLFVIDILTGRTLWHYRTRNALRAPVAVLNQMVFVGSSDNYIYALNESDGRLRWRARTGAGVQSVTVTDRGLLVVSLDNFVYKLSFSNGKKIWKRQLAGRVAAQPVADEEVALFVPLAGDECVILDLKDGRKVNSLTVGEDNNTAASPLVINNLLLLTTRKGLYAYGGTPTPSS